MDNKKSISLDIDNEIVSRVFGAYDANIKKIEKKFGISIVIRDNKIKIIGDDVYGAKDLISLLIDKASRGNDISEQELNYCMDMVDISDKKTKNDLIGLDDDIISRTVQGKPIKAKTLGQKKYVESIKKNMITLFLLNQWLQPLFRNIKHIYSGGD